MRQDFDIRAARMAHADTVIVCLLPLAKNAMHSPTSKLLLRYYSYRSVCEKKNGRSSLFLRGDLG